MPLRFLLMCAQADYCHKPSGWSAPQLYGNLSAALNATGRSILFSLCEWGSDDVLSWGASVGQMYRIQQDHLPFWRFPGWGAGAGFGQGTLDIIEYVATIKPSTVVQQYGWIDPDFLETLFPLTMSFTDSRTEYTFWSLWSAPLVIATDIRNMTAEMKSIVMNPDVIAIDQDRSFTGGDRIANFSSGAQIWARDLHGGDKAVVLFNAGDVQDVPIAVTWAQLGWPVNAAVHVRDLWLQADRGTFVGGFNSTVAPHDVAYLRVRRAD